MATPVSELRSRPKGEYAALDDRMLVLDFQAGQPEAFVEIHDRYGALVRHVCRRLLPNPQDADDAFQETMIRVFQGLYRFNGRYALQPWIARIATNVSLDAIRGRARRPLADRIEDHEPEDTADGPERLVERLVERDLVLSVLSGLPESHRRALVLRELDGRSHREIAEDMGMTPAQAKALIHRAKGSFRREWLVAITHRGGLAGLALVPLLWFVRLADAVRRFADRAGEVGQVAATQAVTAATATPAVQVAASQTGERVIAAAVTLLVAGGVTVGAAALTHRGQEARRVTAAPVPATVQATPPPQTDRAVGDPAVTKDEGRHVPVTVVAPPVVEPSPSAVDPVTPTPTPDSSATPLPPPSVVPPPVIPPAPDWSGRFQIDWTSQDECGCGSGVSVGSTTVSGQLTDGSALDVDQSFQGAALDAEGDAAWAVSAEYQAHLTTDGGTVAFVFILGSGDDTHQYVMSGSSPAIDGTPGDGNPVVYTFSGSYSGVGASSDTSPIPVQGSVQLRLSVWGDGTSVYTVGFDAWR